MLKLISVFLKNPQGITVSSEKIYPVKGMKSGKYAIPEIARCEKQCQESGLKLINLITFLFVFVYGAALG